MQFQISGSQEVRKFVVGFIEEACKKDPNFLSRVMPNLGMLLMDESVDVRKRVIRALTFLYKLCLQWLSKVKVHSNISESHPHFLNQNQNHIFFQKIRKFKIAGVFLTKI